MAASLCGVWVDEGGRVHLAETADGGARVERSASYEPFAWLRPDAAVVGVKGVRVEPLQGEGVFTHLAHAASSGAFEHLLNVTPSANIDALRPPESEYLLQTRTRLFADLTFGQLRRCQLDLPLPVVA